MNPIIVTAAAAVIGHVLALLALWLRLRWRIQWEHAHRRCLVAVARTMTQGGQIHERRPDDIQLTIAVSPARTGGRARG